MTTLRLTREKMQPRAARQIRSMMIAAGVFVALITIMSLIPRERQTVTTFAYEEYTLVINEGMSSNKTAVADDNGAFSDWIEILNTGRSPVRLLDCGLSDDNSQVKFQFPDIELAPGAAIVVWLDDSLSVAGSLHAPFKMSAAGETIYLFDPSGVYIDIVVFPTLERDMSYSRVPLNGADGVSEPFVVTSRITPGYPNTADGYALFRSGSTPKTSALLLNEIMPRNRSVYFDEDGDASDWIELINTGSSDIMIGGFGLTDNETRPLKWTFPEGTVVKANSTLIVFASGKNRDGGVLHTSFKIDGDKETIALSDNYGRLLDMITVEDVPKDMSFARQEGIDIWRVDLQPTPNHTNNTVGVVATDADARRGEPLIITEVVTYSSGMATPYGTTSYDWVEILNTSNESINLLGYGLSDKPGRPRLWQFPDVSIEPGEYLLVFLSGLTEPPKGSSAIHAPFRLSAVGGEITISDETGRIIDRLAIPNIEADMSYGRSLALGSPMYYDKPTPGAPNGPGVVGYATAPLPDKQGGSFKSAITVSFAAPAGTIVRYTLDGSDPTDASELYTEPINIKTTTVLRARSFRDGLRSSEIVTNTYLIGLYHELPVISLVTDPDNLWNPVSGIYAGDYTQSAKTKVAYNDLPYWQKNLVAGHFEFFESDGTRVESAGVELGLHGNFSLDIPQKSFRVTAKARYGATELKYSFFPDREWETYQSLVIRNGGNDGKYTRIVDGLQSRIVDLSDTTVYHQPTRAVVVYLNGRYWGHYNIRERVNTHSLARYEGWDDPDNIDLIKADNNVLSGTFSNYSQLMEFVKTHDLNDVDALKTVLDWIDVDNYFDYMIFEMYFGNTDTGNIKFYRYRAAGEKWRWVLFDLDWGLFNSANDGCQIWLDPKGSGTMNYNNTIIRKLLEVPQMRDKFLRRYGQLFQNVFVPETMIEMARQMADEIDLEMQLHFDRWAYENTPKLDIEAPSNPQGAYAYWRQRLTRLENVILKRNNLVWGHVQNWFALSDAQMIGYFGERPPLPDGE